MQLALGDRRRQRGHQRASPHGSYRTTIDELDRCELVDRHHINDESSTACWIESVSLESRLDLCSHASD